MILSINLNPYIDVNIEVDSLSIGKTNKIISKRTFYTGKGINVAIGLSRLGASAFLTGFMYEDNGRLFEQELHKEGVNYKLVWNGGRVKENYKFIDHKSMMTEIDDISTEIGEDKKGELINLLSSLASQSEAVVLAGSSSDGIDAEYYHALLAAAPDSMVKVVDAEGDRLFAALKRGVTLVKPNLEELQRTFGKQIKSKEALISSCGQLISLGTKLVLVSLGKKGAVITDGKRSFYCKSINVAMNSTAGAGDAMVAAATKALVEGGDMKDILRCGVAAGTAAVTLPDSISFKKEKYDEVLSSLEVKEI